MFLFDKEFIALIIFNVLCTSFTILLLVIAYLVAPFNSDLEKASSYECGFEPFDSTRLKFDVQFYLIAILFIIFDLEIVFLFPWCSAAGIMPAEGIWVLIIFLAILTIGFIYEWCEDALTWK